MLCPQLVGRPVFGQHIAIGLSQGEQVLGHRCAPEGRTATVTPIGSPIASSSPCKRLGDREHRVLAGAVGTREWRCRQPDDPAVTVRSLSEAD